MQIIKPPVSQNWYERNWTCQYCGVVVRWSRQDFDGGLVHPVYQKSANGDHYVAGAKTARCPGCHGQQIMQ